MNVLIVSLAFLAISILLIWYLISYEKGPKEPKGALWTAFGFGIMALLVTPEITHTLIGSIEDLEKATLPVLFVSSLGVGFFEEIFKFVPFALFVYKKEYFTEHSDGIIYFSIIGLTFGFFENLEYTLIYGAEVGLSRLIVLPIFHGAITGILGYFLARHKIKKTKWTKTVLIVLVGALIHGIYNFGAGSELPFFILLSLMLTVMLVIGLFLFYSEARKQDVLYGLSAFEKNKFCRYCGKENPKRTVYCQYCGKKL